LYSTPRIKTSYITLWLVNYLCVKNNVPCVRRTLFCWNTDS